MSLLNGFPTILNTQPYSFFPIGAAYRLQKDISIPKIKEFDSIGGSGRWGLEPASLATCVVELPLVPLENLQFKILLRHFQEGNDH